MLLHDVYNGLHDIAYICTFALGIAAGVLCWGTTCLITVYEKLRVNVFMMGNEENELALTYFSYVNVILTILEA